jgi:formylglycine-generating enzyme required for sulfatase activity
VGDPGNACDPQYEGCFGSVDYVYRISKYEVSNAQYAEFLNAVADTDTHGLYNTNMANSSLVDDGYGGITRSGIPGSYTYNAIAGRENMPVNWVSFYDALRFVNWLNNGQGNADTENGAYTITADGIAYNTITRNAGATIVLTSEDERYKAAHFDGTGYFDYSAGSDTQITCAVPGATPNTANCDRVMGGTWGDLTEVGAYTGSASPYGTFDQGGNAWEWNEAINGGYRGLRGAGFFNPAFSLSAGVSREGDVPIYDYFAWGFRVAMIP